MMGANFRKVGKIYTQGKILKRVILPIIFYVFEPGGGMPLPLASGLAKLTTATLVWS